MRSRAILLVLVLTAWGAIAAAPTAADVEGFRTLYTFMTKAGGEFPSGRLVAVDGVLYGTTYRNGGNDPRGYGIVFAMSTAGVERELYKFKGKPGGEHPLGGLVAINGELYGTAQGGRGGDGIDGCGVVFKITTSGVERVLYTFKCEIDGSRPSNNLLVANGRLYGTTATGGSIGAGTVFELSLSGVKRTLYQFQGAPDCSDPDEVIEFGGKLYGTAAKGGANGAGCVFELSSAGAERVVYSFKTKHDGNFPAGALTALNGKLYGATLAGGTGNYPLGNGTIFEVSLPGTERVVYEFKGKSVGDGASPNGALVAVNGELYGTTAAGAYFADGPGPGTVFKVSPEGVEHVLHGFTGQDGAFPLGGLLALNGKFYGTTQEGGMYGSRGTVFVQTP